MVSRAEEGKVRLIEPRLVQVDEGGRDAQTRAASTIAEANVGAAGFSLRAGIADVGERAGAGDSAALERAEVLARLRHFPTRQRNEDWHRTFGDLFRRRRRGGPERLPPSLTARSPH